LWTHYFGVFIVGAEALVLLWLRPGERAPTLVACAAIAVGVTPLLFLVAHQTGDERSRYIAGIPLSRRLEQTVRQFAMGANVPRTWLEASGLAIACAGLGAGGLLATRDGRRPRAVLALALIAFLVPLALAVTR